MRKAKLIAAVVMLLLAGIVVLQNTDSIQTDILWIHVEMPRVVLLAVTLVIGVLGGYLLATWRQRKVASATGAAHKPAT